MKKLFAIALAAVMVCSLAACGASGSAPAATEAAKTETQAAAAAETQAKEEAKAEVEEVAVGVKIKDLGDGVFTLYDEEAPEVEATGEPIKIGGFGALTGTSAAGGNTAYRGIQLAQSWINSHGGINGRPLDVIYYDDATTPEGAVKAVTRLIDEDEVPIILGGHISPDVLAAMDYTESAGVPMLGIGTGLSFTRCGAEYTMRGTFSGYGLYPTLLDTLKTMGTKNVAFFYAENDFGQAAEKYFIQDGAFTQAGIEVVETVAYPKAETDFTGHIAKALAKNPESIVIISAANTEYSLFIKQLRQQGFKGLVYGPENVGTLAVLETAGELAEGSIFATAVLFDTDPTSKNYEGNEQGSYLCRKWYETYGELLNSEAGFRGWDEVMIAACALLQAEDVNDPEELNSIIWNMKGYKGLQGVFDYTAGDGEGLPSVRACMILDGKFQYLDVDAVKAWLAAQN